MRWKIFFIEVIILGIFWLTLHHSCERMAYRPVTQTDTTGVTDYRDADDTIPDIGYEQNYIDSGQVLFRRYCAACHSFGREGSGPVMDTSISFKHFEESVMDISDLARRYEHTSKLMNKYQYVMPKFNEILTPEQARMIKEYTIHEMETRCGFEEKNKTIK